MLKLLNIWLFAFCIVGLAQNYIPVTELSFPSRVPINSSFDISLVTDNSLLSADKLNLYLISKNDLSISNTQIRTEDLMFQKTLIPATLQGISDKVYLLELELQTQQYTIQSFFQLLITINSSSFESIDVRFYGEFLRDKKVISKIGALENSIVEPEKNLIAEIYTYKPGKAARNAAKFDSTSKISFDLKNFSANKLWIGFWIKPSGSDSEFLKIVNKNSNLPLFILGINKFQKIYLLDQNKNINNQTAPFLSKRTWSHIGIEFNTNSKTVTFLKDGNEFVKTLLTGFDQTDDLEIIFGGESKSPFTVEQLRIIKLKDDHSLAVNDAKYISISSATGRVMLQVNFDSMNELTSTSFINHRGIKLVGSDAPIFSRSPILNVQVLSRYNLLEWSTPDIKNVSQFIVEKSSSDNQFYEIGNVSVAGNVSGNFNYIDASIKADEIIFYRIKQINKDGTSVYSTQIKVGMGTFEQFRLGQNYPNPFNPVTRIEFDLYEESEIEVIIYNLEGQEMAVIHRGFLSKGVHKFEFDASNLPSGVYLYKVSSPFYSQTKKMLLTK